MFCTSFKAKVGSFTMKFSALFILFLSALSHQAYATTNLIMIGGGKRPKVAIEAFVKAAGSEKAKILICPWASESTESAANIKAELEAYHPSSIEVMPQYFLKKTSYNKLLKANLKKFDSATGIFFTGGNQNKLMKAIFDLNLKEYLKTAYLNGVAFAGTSAGTAIMSERMLTGEGNFTVLDGKQVNLAQGLGLLPHEVIVDQHFIVRHRFNRLASVILDQDDEAYGIAIDENNALHVINNRMARVIGPTYVMSFSKNSSKSLTVQLHGNQELFNLFDLKSNTP